MSYNDRLREASQWVAAHPGDMILLEIPRDAFAEALWEASDDCRWPPALSGWARDLARRTRGMCRPCLDASTPADWWADRAEWLEAVTQPTHADCTRSCECPCKAERATVIGPPLRRESHCLECGGGSGPWLTRQSAELVGLLHLTNHHQEER